MKFLIFALLFSMLAPFSPFRVIDSLEEALESCDIDTNEIEEIGITANGEDFVSVNIESVLETEVIDTLEPDAEGRFQDIPEDTELVTIGLISLEETEPDQWGSFGVVKNEEMERYWLILFPTNIFLTDSLSCGAFEIVLEVPESDA